MKPTTQISQLTVLGLSLLALGISDGSLAADTPAGASKPNLVVFLTDDQGQLDCSAYGGQGIRAPNMQRLADAGMTFTRAYVASPSCAPSRAALLPASCRPATARKPITPRHARS